MMQFLLPMSIIAVSSVMHMMGVQAHVTAGGLQCCWPIRVVWLYELGVAVGSQARQGGSAGGLGGVPIIRPVRKL